MLTHTKSHFHPIGHKSFHDKPVIATNNFKNVSISSPILHCGHENFKKLLRVYYYYYYYYNYHYYYYTLSSFASEFFV